MICNCIWDFDGMLFDSYPHMIEAERRMLRDKGFDRTYGELFAPMKISVGHCMKQFFPTYGVDMPLTHSLNIAYNRYEGDLDMEPVAKPFPAIPALLRALRAAGRHSFVYSHRASDTLERYLAMYSLRELFDDCVTGEQPFPHKPAPDAILYLLAKHKLDPRETCMLGDREIDVESGKNAGVTGVLFDEFGTQAATKADARVTDISQLYGVLGIARAEEDKPL